MSAQSDSPIRTLDVAALDAARRPGDAVVGELMESLRTGFVYVRHDASAELVAEAYAVLERLFALSPETKDGFTPTAAMANAGYRGLSSERAVGKDVADWKETFQWCTALPAGHPLRERFPHRYPEPQLPEADVPGFGAALGALRDTMLAAQLVVMRAIVVGLGAAPDVADDLMADADVVTRALHYPPLPAGSATTWADEHVDINLVTVLPPATLPGLEVATEDGWVPADPAPGHLVLNTGAMLERLSNGAVPAGVHRVRPPGGGHERYSIAQFAHPAPWTMLAPLQATVTADAPQRFGAYQAAELLERTIWAIRQPAVG